MVIKILLTIFVNTMFLCIKPLWWLILVPNINKIHLYISAISVQTYWIYDIMYINATFWHTCLCNIHQVPIVVDYCTNMNKITPFFSDIATNKKFKKNIVIDAQIWHRATWYFTYVSNTLYLSNVPNKINPYFSEISLQNVWKNGHNYSNLIQRKCDFNCMSNIWYMIIVPIMNKIATFFSKISQQTLKIYEKIHIITQIWHRAKFYLCALVAHGTWWWYLISRKSIQP